MLTLRHVRYHQSLAASSFRCLPEKWLSIIIESLSYVLDHLPLIAVMIHNTFDISSLKNEKSVKCHVRYYGIVPEYIKI